MLFSAWPAQAASYTGNGDTGFGGAIGNGTLTLSDDGTNISGALTVGGSMNDVLVHYTNELTQVGAENRVTVSPLGGSQFFRAQYP